MERSFEAVAGCPLAAIDRQMFNDNVVIGCRLPGEGMFMRALRERLHKLQIEVPWLEYDLIAEMHGLAQPLDFSGASRISTPRRPGEKRAPGRASRTPR
jgi:hypothetical protein